METCRGEQSRSSSPTSRRRRISPAPSASYAEVLSESRQLLRGALAERGGVEVDTQGDGLFAAFDTARDAVHATAAAQRSHAAHVWPEGGTYGSGWGCTRQSLPSGRRGTQVSV